MRSWLRIVIVWLMALALPVQVLASATMLHCGPGHQRQHAAQMGTGAAAASHHDHAQHASSSAPHHHEAMDAVGLAAPADQAAAPTDGAAPPAQLADLGKYKCSACASCGSVCALLSSMPKIPAPEFTATVFVAVVPAIEAFAVDGPERPPRSVLV